VISSVFPISRPVSETLKGCLALFGLIIFEIVKLINIIKIFIAEEEVCDLLFFSVGGGGGGGGGI